MKNIDELLSKFIKIYDDFNKKQISDMDNKKQNLQVKLKKEEDKFNELLKIKERIKKDDKRYDEVYNSLINVLKSRGISFNIPNNNFSIKEWDNLFIKKVSNSYIFVNKNGDLLYAIEKKYNNCVEHIVNNYSYSVIVTRKTEYSMKVQLRIN